MVNNTRLTVAVFGGSFDPPHQGHQQIVIEVLKHLNIDKLIILPTYLNPFKSSSLSGASQRFKWCKDLFSNTPKVIVSDYEIKQNRSVKTVESIKYFQKYYNVQYLIIGSDNLSTVTQWYNFNWLNKEITWVVVTRPGFSLITQMLNSWKLLTLNMPISSSQIKKSGQTEYIDKKIVSSVKYILKGQSLNDN
ncbi:MAG: nicotinate (nicotinamide) nucleotide adenylyltransferase [Sulfurovum sp.]|nr:nicotinate (nicotinamide) nucleotide adenylyltransferase [Sulfurovum sp.]MCB4744520.1 nicotinate (nicotinamide) nucleotide adenylyltransferase [Sulfurovum sp.]MCB4746145.1 nicotinate (nicotinamide) nucleotide adenylyltransferase [Sulfurovum sp.]MCB4748885.1 nicotinate (nicotinamide) nucleotide adenylyltransferase [Sulfurovum sp.]MCB4750761.1 nicotinate (nicotinamide) nucleotide adenylyltransferase [Sulfurovum sp.]